MWPPRTAPRKSVACRPKADVGAARCRPQPPPHRARLIHGCDIQTPRCVQARLLVRNRPHTPSGMVHLNSRGPSDRMIFGQVRCRFVNAPAGAIPAHGAACHWVRAETNTRMIRIGSWYLIWDCEGVDSYKYPNATGGRWVTHEPKSEANRKAQPEGRHRANHSP